MKNKYLLEQAKKADYVFISIMGPHAQEGENEILDRKTSDLNASENSFWVSKIWRTKAMINRKIEECNIKLSDKDGYLILVEGNAEDTKEKREASHYSKDYKKTWEKIGDNISKVTGNWGDDGALAYYFDAIERFDDEEDQNINLNYYSEVGVEQRAIKFGRGHSNVFAQKNLTPVSGGMSSHKRKIVAVLRLKSPYVVWVK